MKVCIIGSGQAALSAAETLAERGIKPVILDIGETLDKGTAQRVATLARTRPKVWDETQAPFPSGLESGGAVPRKAVFGSEFIFAQNREDSGIIQSNVNVAMTQAKGGFSLAWGAAVLPAREEDLNDWPAETRPTPGHYEQAMKSMPLVGSSDDSLAQAFPSYAPHMQTFPPTPQGAALLHRMTSLETGKSAPQEIFHSGRARLAVNGPRCVNCGICLAGCPYGAIHSLDRRLNELIAKKSVDYRPNTQVIELKEEEQSVAVYWHDTVTGDRKTSVFDRVFVAAGPVGTARIILQSIKAYGQTVTLLDSAKFAVPLLLKDGPALNWPHATTLADVFIEARLPTVSERWLHLQVSPLNDLVIERLRMGKGRRLNLLGRLSRPLLSRLMIAWCGIHSESSTACQLTLNNRDGAPILTASAGPSRTDQTMKAYGRALLRHGLKAGILFLPAAAASSTPGATGHTGGTFPMQSDAPGPLETDTLGRPAGWRLTHIVDASTFPSIPGTTIALLIRANARRIAGEVADSAL